jgi:hypothetical protein
METKKVSELQDKEYILIMDTEEINHILEYANTDSYYPCLIVRIEDGEYKEIWGCDNYIPLLNNLAERIL